LLAGSPFDVRMLDEFSGARAPEETEDSYRGNALLKARAAAGFSGLLALADDSGLEVDALGGLPGVRSARFGGPGLDDAGRCRRLLEVLREVPDEQRTGRFRCVIAVVEPHGREDVVDGVVEGVILTAPRGKGGFGYDPLFFYPPLGRTLAELSETEKAAVSHRGRALAAAGRLLRECYTAEPAG
jgi:XTP/dITP diphosphohydrolase